MQINTSTSLIPTTELNTRFPSPTYMIHDYCMHAV